MFSAVGFPGARRLWRHAPSGVCAESFANLPSVHVCNFSETAKKDYERATSRHVVYVGGVAADGKTPKDTRTPAQKKAMEAYVKDFRRRFPSIPVVGHNQLAAKACPSFDVQAWLKEIGINQ